MKGEKKLSQTNKNKNLRDVVTSRHALQERLKEVCQREGKLYTSETQLYMKAGRVLQN